MACAVSSELEDAVNALKSLRASQCGRVSTMPWSSMPASGEPTMLRTLSRAEWKLVWPRACCKPAGISSDKQGRAVV